MATGKKTGGREKGTANKVTAELKTWINNLIEDNRETLEKDLKELEPRERWAIVEKLINYTIPKQRAIDTKINFEELHEEDIDIIINRLAEGLK